MSDPQGGPGAPWPGYPQQQPAAPQTQPVPAGAGWAQPSAPPAGYAPGYGGYAPGSGQGYPPGPGYPPPGYGPQYMSGFGNAPIAPWMMQARYAGFWIRFVAYLIDGFVMFLICLTIIGIFFVPFYMPLMWWKKGGTLGQQMLGLRVVRTVDGGPISGQAATVRALVMYFISGIFYLGYIWAAFEPRKRSWHDMLADTVVIHV